jgi:hypothetical protein
VNLLARAAGARRRSRSGRASCSSSRHDREEIAADSVHGWLDHGEHRCGGDGGVDGVAALLRTLSPAADASARLVAMIRCAP